MMIRSGRNRILVFGGSGYLGSNISMYLRDFGHDVTIVRRKVVPDLIDFSILNIVQFEIGYLREILRDFDTILYLAGANSLECHENLLGSFESNVINLIKLIEAAKVAEITNFFYFSSIHVYSKPLIGQYCENSATANFHPYASFKITVENHLKWASENSNLNVVINRLANCYGFYSPNSKLSWNLVVNDFCRQAVLTRQIVIRSDADETRNYLAVVDFCKIVMFQLENVDYFATNQTINLTSNTYLRLHELAEIVSHRVNRKLGYLPKVLMHNCNKNFNDGLYFCNSKLTSKYKFNFCLIENEIDRIIDLVDLKLC